MQPQFLESGHGGFDDVGRIIGAKRLAQNVFNTRRFKDSANRFSGNKARAWGSWTQQNLGAAIAAENFMRNGCFLQRNVDHPLLGHFAAFANGFGNFDSLAQAQADASMLVASDDQGAKAEAASAFDNLGRAVDENHFFAQFRTAAAILRWL